MNKANILKIWRKDMGRRLLAGLLCLCSILSLFSSFGSTAAEAAGAEPAQNTAVTESAPASEEPADEPMAAAELKALNKDDIPKNLPAGAEIKGAGAEDAIKKLVADANEGGGWEQEARPLLYWTYEAKSDGSGGNGLGHDFCGVRQRNYIHVYAKAGEFIALGTNVTEARTPLDSTQKLKTQQDAGSIDIVLHWPNGDQQGIDITTNGAGHIRDWQTDKAVQTQMYRLSGVEVKYGGGKDDYTYTPFVIPITKDGVYTFEFRSIGSGSYKTGEKNFDFNNASDSGNVVQAWDASVYGEDGYRIPGRTYADYLALQMTPDTTKAPAGVREDYYIVTSDSYIYKMQFLDATPYTYNFFANNRGLIDSATGDIVYKSIKAVDNTKLSTAGFQNMGVEFLYPGVKDSDLAKSYYIFFQEPDPDLKGILFERAIEPDAPTDIQFITQIPVNEDDPDGEKEPGTYVGQGGYFSFTVQEATTASLRLVFRLPLDQVKAAYREGDGYREGVTIDDADKNIVTVDGYEYKIEGTGGDKDRNVVFEPVEISNVVTPYSTNRFKWDGRDGNGVIIPPGNYTLDDILYTVTAKAGEIHFPIFDMEGATKGFNIERISNLYDKNGNLVDDVTGGTTDNIYKVTRGVIYYDDSAIYYGENVASTGLSESEAYYATDNGAGKKGYTIGDYIRAGNLYYPFNNISGVGNSEYDFYNRYAQARGLRVGDHSHTSNEIQYFDETGALIKEPTSEQQAMINALREDVGRAGSNITDYGIANFWTFTPSRAGQPGDPNAAFEIRDGEKFNISGRVFYDEGSDGLYEPQEDGDTLLSGVALNLYKKVESGDKFNEAKKNSYYQLTGDKDKMVSLGEITAEAFAYNKTTMSDSFYMLVDTSTTTLYGDYAFANLPYPDKDETATYAYEVVRPNDAYELTSGDQGGIPTTAKDRGYYNLHSHITAAKFWGTELQIFTVRGKDKTAPAATEYDPYSYDDGKVTDKTFAVMDVGYHYETFAPLTLKKVWTKTKEEGTPQDMVAFQLSYVYGQGNDVAEYQMVDVAAILNLNDALEYLPKCHSNGEEISVYYVSAEYYVNGTHAYKHTYDFSSLYQRYNTSVSKTEQFDIDKYLEAIGRDEEKKATYTISDFPDLNEDGLHNIEDLAAVEGLKEKGLTGWEEAENPPYKSVIDMNPTASGSTITVTNTDQMGTIEIRKYTGETTLEKAEFLDGAVFRAYKGEVSEVKPLIEEYYAALAAGETEKANGAYEKLKERFVNGNANYTSRAGSGIATITNLDPNAIYTIREVYAPSGFQVSDEYYQVVPKGQKESYKYPEDSGSLTYEFGESFGPLVDGLGAEATTCRFPVVNTVASKELQIRKQIAGRSWLADKDKEGKKYNDTYTFDISFTKLTEGGDIPTTAFTLADDEQFINGGYETAVKDFIGKFNGAEGAEIVDDVTINYDSPFYKDERASTQNDTKTTDDKIITKAEETDGGAHTWTGAKLNGEPFPAAGRYIFNIKENVSEDAKKDSTASYSTRNYTVTVNVTRVWNDGREVPVEAGGEATTDNTHLEASVSNISYTETDADGNTTPSYKYGAPDPLFTNTYTVAPAVIDSSYAVTKVISGRDWGDAGETYEFQVTSTDDETIQAIRDGRLVLENLGTGDSGAETSSWPFTITNDVNHMFGLGRIDAINTLFPVEAQLDGSFVTGPRVYTLNFTENIPEEVKQPENAVYRPVYIKDKNTAGSDPGTEEYVLYYKHPETGMLYAATEYTLKITLKNTTEGDESGADTNGVIEEIDLQMTRTETVAKDGEGNDAGSKTYDLGTCKIQQQRLDLNDPEDKKIYDENAGKNNNIFTAGTSEDPIYIYRSHEEHSELAHGMVFTNLYEAAGAEYMPNVAKIVRGRDVNPADKFTFTMSVAEKDGYTFLADKAEGDGNGLVDGDIPYERQTIDGESFGETSDHSEGKEKAVTFQGLMFTKPGTYTVTFTETDAVTEGADTMFGERTRTFVVIVIVTDNGKGQLVPTYQNQDDPYSAPETTGPAIKFVNKYLSPSSTFEIAVDKSLVGRELDKDNDEFTFTLQVGPVAQRAINAGAIIMPEKGKGDPTNSLVKTEGEEGLYTMVVNGDNAGDTMVEHTGPIQFVAGDYFDTCADYVWNAADHTRTATYKFSVYEDEDDRYTSDKIDHLPTLPSPLSYELTVTVTKHYTDEGIPTNQPLDIVITYTYEGEETAVTVGSGASVTLSFRNTIIGDVKISKEVVSWPEDLKDNTEKQNELLNAVYAAHAKDDTVEGHGGGFEFNVRATTIGAGSVDVPFTGPKTGTLHKKDGTEQPITLTFDEMGEAKVYLRNGEWLSFTEVSAGTRITVTETDEEGFIPEGGYSKTKTVQLVDGTLPPVVFDFKNHYAPITVTPNIALVKHLDSGVDGRNFEADDNFEFTMAVTAVDPNGNDIDVSAPLPGLDADDVGDVVRRVSFTLAGDAYAVDSSDRAIVRALKTTKKDAQVDLYEKPDAAADTYVECFPLTFTVPGTYTYTFREVNPETGGLAGMTYSNEWYQLVITVTEKTGAEGLTGELQADVTYTSSTQTVPLEVGQVGDESGTPTRTFDFTNRYEANTVSVPVTVAKRMDIRDVTGNDLDKYYFKMESVGWRLHEGSPDTVNDIPGLAGMTTDVQLEDLFKGDPATEGVNQPMPAEGVNEVKGPNASGEVRFGSLVFHAGDLGNNDAIRNTGVEYLYKITETGPVNAENRATIDNRTYYFVVYVHTENVVEEIASDEEKQVAAAALEEAGSSVEDVIVAAPLRLVYIPGEEGTGKLQKIDVENGDYFTDTETPRFKFVNRDASEEVILKGVKNLNRPFLAGDTFTFNMTGVVTDTSTGKAEQAPLPEGAESGAYTKTIEWNGSAEGGSYTAGDFDTPTPWKWYFNFDPITFDADDVGNTYIYTVTEELGNDDTITYSTLKQTVTVRVYIDTAGDLAVNVTYMESTVDEDEGMIAFTNVFTPKPAVFGPDSPGYPFGGKKELEGREWREESDAFSFQLEAATFSAPDTPLPDHTQVQNITEDGKFGNTFKFGEITFTKEGKYVYKITEVNTHDETITYDSESYFVELDVTHNEATGELELGVPVYYGPFNAGEEPTGLTLLQTSSKDCTKEEVEFTNVYSVTGELTISKQVFGVEPGDDEFKVQVTLTTDDNKLLPDHDGLVSVYDTDDNQYNFTDDDRDGGFSHTFELKNEGSITLTLPVGVEYTVKELPDSSNGYSVTYFPTADGRGVIYPGTATVIIQNTKSSATPTLNVVKTLETNGLLEEGGQTFTFTLTPDERNGAGDPVKKEGHFKEITVPKQDGSTAWTASGNIFEGLEYTTIGTYTYTLQETQEEKAGFVYSEDVYTVTVEVKETGGTYSATVIGVLKDGASLGPVGSVTFTNIYGYEPTYVTIQGRKAITGRDWDDAIDNDAYSFTLTAMKYDETDGLTEEIDGDTPMPGGTAARTVTVNNGSTGTIAFGAIEYAKTGTYYYKITEGAVSDSTVTPDGGTVYVKVVVTEDDGTTDDGLKKLTATVTYSKSTNFEGGDVIENESGEADLFTNKYTHPTGSLKVSKRVTGDKADTTKQFDFTVKLTKGNAEEHDSQMAGAVQGAGDLYWNENKKEDDAGNLCVTWSSDPEGVAAEKAEPSAGGTLTFKFSLAHNQSVTFSNIPVGTHYEVVEDDANKDGYAANVDKYEGYISGGAPADASFTNSMGPATVSLPVTKMLDKGAFELQESKTFTIALTPDNGVSDEQKEIDPVRKAITDSGEQYKHKITVGTDVWVATEDILEGFEFTTPGVEESADYKYTLSEVNDDQLGVQYDMSEYEVIVTVKKVTGTTAIYSATVSVEQTVDAEGNKLGTSAPVTGGVTFTNHYARNPATASLGGTKELQGRTLTEADETGGVFSFNIAAVDPLVAPMPHETTVYAKRDGTFSFGDITYPNFGQYLYKITEGNTSAPHVTTDPTVFYALVQVKPEEGTDGQTAEVQYYERTGEMAGEPKLGDLESMVGDGILTKVGPEKVIFTNKYTHPTGELTISKKVTGDGAETDKPFSFTLTLKQGTPGDGGAVAGAGALSSEYEHTHYLKDDTADSDGAYVYNYTYTVEEATVKFQLKDGESLTIKGLPEGTKYEVEEDGESSIGYGVSHNTNSGTIDSAVPGSVTFVNSKGPAVASLVVSKDLTAEDGERHALIEDKTFTFALTPAAENYEDPLKKDPAFDPAQGRKTLTVEYLKGSAGGVRLSDDFFADYEFKTPTGLKEYKYVYTLEELKESEYDNVTWDGTKYTVTVTVTEDPEAPGNYLAAVTVEPNANASRPVEGAGSYSVKVPFDNTYKPREASLELKGTKLLYGGDLKDKTFQFILEPGPSQVPPMPAAEDEIATVAWTVDDDVTSEKNRRTTENSHEKAVDNGDGATKDTFSFGSVTYTEAGQYSYIIREVNPYADPTREVPNSRVIYDRSEYQVTVQVTADSAKSLKAEITGVQYRPSNTGDWTELINDTGSDWSELIRFVNFMPTKTLTYVNGVPMADDQVLSVGDEVTYTIDWRNIYDTPADVEIKDALDEGLEIIIPTEGAAYEYDAANRMVTWKLGQQDPDKYGTVTFTAQVNSVAGERVGTEKQVANTAEVRVGQHWAVTNTVATTVRSYDLTIQKVLEKGVDPGSELSFADDMQPFSFRLKLTDAAGAPLMKGFAYERRKDGRVIDSGTVSMTGSGDVGADIVLYNGEQIVIRDLPEGAAFTLVEAPVQGYKMKAAEVEGGGTYTADSSSMTVTGSANGAMVKVINEKLGFAPATLRVTSEKVYPSGGLTDGAFSFTLAPMSTVADDPLATEAKTVWNGAPDISGVTAPVDFGTLTFNREGVYSYTVRENASSAGVLYDTHSESFTVVVKGDRSTGKLTLESPGLTPLGTDASGNSYEISVGSFTNTALPPGAVAVVLEGTKTIGGRELTPSDTFTFILSPMGGEAAAISTEEEDGMVPGGDMTGEPDNGVIGEPPASDTDTGADGSDTGADDGAGDVTPDAGDGQDGDDASGETQGETQAPPAEQPPQEPAGGEPADQPATAAIEGEDTSGSEDAGPSGDTGEVTPPDGQTGEPLPPAADGEQPGDTGSEPTPGGEEGDPTLPDSPTADPTQPGGEEGDPTLPDSPTVDPTLPDGPTVDPTLPDGPTVDPTMPGDPTADPTLPGDPNMVDDSLVTTVDVPMPLSADITTQNTGSIFRFDPIVFTEAGIYNYQIMEQPGSSAGGMFFDMTQYYVTVTIVDTDGVLSVGSVEYHKDSLDGELSSAGAAFTNQAVVKTETAVNGDSALAGTAVKVDDTISYNIHWTNFATYGDVTVTDLLDPGVTFVSASIGTEVTLGEPGGIAQNADGTMSITTEDDGYTSVIWDLGDRHSGAAGDVQLTVRVNDKYSTGVEYVTDPNDLEFTDSGTEDNMVYNRATVKVTSTVMSAAMDVGESQSVLTDVIPNQVETDAPDVPEEGKGSLQIQKVVTGDLGDRSKGFTFQITLTNADGTPIGDQTIGGIPFSGGIGTVSLRHGETALLPGLPAGTQYTITEPDTGEGYTATWMGNTSGTIGEGTTELVTCINDKTSVPAERENQKGALKIMKGLSNTAREVDSVPFTFQVRVSGTPEVNGMYEAFLSGEGVTSVVFVDGVAEVQLKNMQYITISGLPEGARYSVTEQNTPGYRSQAINASGRLTENEVFAMFVNEPGSSSGPSYPTEPSPSPEPSTSPEPSASPGPSESPGPSASPGPSESPGPGESPGPSTSPGPGESPGPSESPGPGESPGPSATPGPGVTPQPDGRPHKVESAPGAGVAVTVGQWITYEIIWENSTGAAAPVTIRDPLDTGLSFVSAPGGAYDSASRTVTWNLGEQPAGARGSVTLTVSVNETASINGAVLNMAYVKVGSNEEQNTEARVNPLATSITATPAPTAAPGGPGGSGGDNSPKTGDNTAVIFWLAMLALSLTGLGLVTATRKRKKR